MATLSEALSVPGTFKLNFPSNQVNTYPLGIVHSVPGLLVLGGTHCLLVYG